MELIIPGEQHFYMKAVNAAERQRWLVALGSAKACLADTRTKKEKGMYVFLQSYHFLKCLFLDNDSANIVVESQC